MQGDDLAVAAAAAVPVTEKVEESEEKHQQQPPQHEEAVSVLWFLGGLAGLALFGAILGGLGVGRGGGGGVFFFDTVQYWHLCVEMSVHGVVDPSFSLGLTLFVMGPAHPFRFHC